MIPNYFLAALIGCLLYVIILFVKYVYGTILKNKIIDMSIDISICVAVGISWANIMFIGIENKLISILLSIIVGLVIGFILLLILRQKNNNINEKELPKEISYTIDSLVNMTGIIQSYYGDKKYYGKLNDTVGTDIIIKLEGDVPYGSKFIITDINGCDINAKLTE